MKPVFAVDPGLTTGWAHVDCQGNRNWGQVEGVLPFMRFARSALVPTPGILVCEDFVPRGQALTWQPASLHIIGYLMGEADFYGWEFRLQTPAQAKGFATNEKLKRAAWWVPGQDHARDALRHLLTYLCVHVHDEETLRLVAP